jgi:hypothetical protein
MLELSERCRLAVAKILVDDEIAIREITKEYQPWLSRDHGGGWN